MNMTGDQQFATAICLIAAVVIALVSYWLYLLLMQSLKNRGK